MRKSVLVSVIMPVYNPGKYFDTAITGILNQSYENLELICIDDNSTDGSDFILKQYQNCDKRIRIIHHNINMGAACSRNEGIELACGKYIFFVDSDDVFEKDLLKCMIQVAEREFAEMVYINYDIFDDGESYGIDKRGNYYYFGAYFAQYNKKEKCPKGLLKSIPLAPYSRLYLREFIKRNKLEFQNIKSSNDVYFGILATSLSKRIAFLGEQINLIHVREHKGRYRISNQRDPYDNFRAYVYLLQKMKELRLSDMDIEIVQERFLDNILWELKICVPEQREKFYRFISMEGLKEMEILKEDRFFAFDPVAQEIAESFCIKPLESRWFENISLTGCYIRKHKKRVKNFFEQIEEQGKVCGVWGAGKDGGLLADFCAENHCQCKGFTDSDKKKWGETLSGYRVFSPQELLSVVDTVVVLNQNYFNDIYDQINKICKGMEMVSLSLYLQHEQDLRSSTIMVLD